MYHYLPLFYHQNHPNNPKESPYRCTVTGWPTDVNRGASWVSSTDAMLKRLASGDQAVFKLAAGWTGNSRVVWERWLNQQTNHHHLGNMANLKHGGSPGTPEFSSWLDLQTCQLTCRANEKFPVARLPNHRGPMTPMTEDRTSDDSPTVRSAFRNCYPGDPWWPMITDDPTSPPTQLSGFGVVTDLCANDDQRRHYANCYLAVNHPGWSSPTIGHLMRWWLPPQNKF